MKYLAWVGQNATTGTPNPTTGRMSLWGDLHAFNTKAERDEFCDKWNDRHNTYPVKTNRKDARQYFLGMTMASYNENIDALMSGYVDKL